MQAEDIDQIVQEILSDISRRDKASTDSPEPSIVSGLKGIFEELIHEDDETSQQVMRRIWKELQDRHHAWP